MCASCFGEVLDDAVAEGVLSRDTAKRYASLYTALPDDAVDGVARLAQSAGRHALATRAVSMDHRLTRARDEFEASFPSLRSA
jgi:hypothetical protein